MKRFDLIVCGLLILGTSFGCTRIDGGTQLQSPRYVETIVADKSDQNICFYWTDKTRECYQAFFGAPNTPTPEGTWEADRFDPWFYNSSGDGSVIDTPILLFSYTYDFYGKIKMGYGIHASSHLNNGSLGCIRVGFPTSDYLRSLVISGAIRVATVHGVVPDSTTFNVLRQDPSPTRIVVQP
jgi:hypothetical protein